MLSQKEAVYKAVTAKKQEDGSFDRKEVIDELFNMFRAGEFIHKDPSKVAEDKALRDMCGGILSNWLRKDSRLGGAEPAATRQGRKRPRPVDDEMKRLMRAKVVLTTEGQPTQEIDDLIQQRTSQIESERTVALNETIKDAEALLAAVNSPSHH
jgi:hypothetical protein